MIRIANRRIGTQERPYLIAEMSGNHQRSLERALQIVDAAASAGADAVKLQTYTPDTMTLDVDAPGFVITDSESLWAGRRLHELYEEAHTPWEWHAPIMERAAARGMHCFSTPFDETAVDFLESLSVPAYKIASFECTDLPLIRKAAGTGKPLIVSTGMASAAEIDEAVRAARSAGCDDLVLLKCTSAYPATPAGSNLRTIPHLRQLFDCEVGLSDHTLGLGAAVAAVAMGASVIEKHLTLSRAEGGVDAAFSMEPTEFRMLAEETDRAWRALGGVSYGPGEQEKASLQFRRSLYVAEDLPAGGRLTRRNLRIVRPGFGLPPAFYEVMLGRTVARAHKRGDPLTWDSLREEEPDGG